MFEIRRNIKKFSRIIKFEQSVLREANAAACPPSAVFTQIYFCSLISPIQTKLLEENNNHTETSLRTFERIIIEQDSILFSSIKGVAFCCNLQELTFYLGPIGRKEKKENSRKYRDAYLRNVYVHTESFFLFFSWTPLKTQPEAESAEAQRTLADNGGKMSSRPHSV